MLLPSPSRRREGEGSSIHPMFRRPQVDVLQGSTRSHVGAIGKISIPIARLVKPKRGSEGEAALQIDDRVELPPAHQLVRDTLDAAQECLPFPKRQFIHATQAKPMPDIKSGQAVVSLAIVRVHDDTDLSAGLRSGNRGGIIQAASVCIVGSQSQSIAKAAIHVNKATVEIVDAGRKENTRTAQLWITANHRIWEVLGSSRKTRRAGRCRANGRECLVGISTENLVVAVRSDVAHTEADVAR